VKGVWFKKSTENLIYFVFSKEIISQSSSSKVLVSFEAVTVV
jgi:hypothetical protein